LSISAARTALGSLPHPPAFPSRRSTGQSIRLLRRTSHMLPTPIPRTALDPLDL
jgi:hypothetical protein